MALYTILFGTACPGRWRHCDRRGGTSSAAQESPFSCVHCIRCSRLR